MLLPGAQIFVHLPKLLKEDLALRLVVEPTVMAASTKAGEYLHESSFSFPAATTTTTPALVAAFTAVLVEELVPLPPRLMLAIRGWRPLLAIQSKAELDQDNLPVPSSPKTLTPYTRARVATPNDLPAALPAQWVPCPCRSREQVEELLEHSCNEPPVRSKPGTARLLNSLCVWRTPVSNT